jgi:hypothetical protein
MVDMTQLLTEGMVIPYLRKSIIGNHCEEGKISKVDLSAETQEAAREATTVELGEVRKGMTTFSYEFLIEVRSVLDVASRNSLSFERAALNFGGSL